MGKPHPRLRIRHLISYRQKTIIRWLGNGICRPSEGGTEATFKRNQCLFRHKSYDGLLETHDVTPH